MSRRALVEGGLDSRPNDSFTLPCSKHLIKTSWVVVDSALEIVEEYQSKILSLEQHILIKPSMKSVRRRTSCFHSRCFLDTHLWFRGRVQFPVHIISGDLILHKRTLEPIKTLVYALRRYDVDRVAAMQEKLDPGVKIEGFMSHKAKIYLVRRTSHVPWLSIPLYALSFLSGRRS